MRKPEPKIKFTFNEWCIDIISKAPNATSKKWPYAGPPGWQQTGIKYQCVLYWWFLYLRFYRA